MLKNFSDGICFSCAQQSIVDKDTSQLVSNGSMNQCSGYTGINPTTQSQNDFFISDLLRGFPQLPDPR
jgi:hypothetical protein